MCRFCPGLCKIPVKNGSGFPARTPRALLARRRYPALRCSSRISCSRLLSLILGHKCISLLTHAFACPVTGRSYIKVGVAKGYVGLSLFKQCLVVHNSSAIGSYPSHVRLTRRAAEQYAERRNDGES